MCPLHSFCRPGDDEAFFLIKVALQPTAFAVNGLSNLPQCVSTVCLVLFVEGSINAGAVQELVEELFIGSLVDS